MGKPLIPGGYVMLPRQIIEDEIWDKPPLYLKVWLYILQRAQHSEYNNMKRGETHISIPEIIEACSWKVGYRTVKPKKDEVYQAIDWMRKKSDTKATPNSTMEATPNPTTIATTKATHGLFVKVLHYGFFQDSKNYESNAESNKESNNEITYEEDTNPSNINKNVKNAKNDKKKEPSSRKKKIDYKDHHMKLAELLRDHVTANNKYPDKMNIEDWANEMRIMMEHRNIEGKDLQDVILFSQKDPFWKTNIRSASKLKEKFSRLHTEMIEKQNKERGNKVSYLDPHEKYRDDSVDTDEDLLRAVSGQLKTDGR